MKKTAKKEATATYVSPIVPATMNVNTSAMRMSVNAHDKPPTILLLRSLLLSLSSAFLPIRIVSYQLYDAKINIKNGSSTTKSVKTWQRR